MTSFFSIIMAIYDVPVVIVEEDSSILPHKWDSNLSGGGAVISHGYVGFGETTIDENQMIKIPMHNGHWYQ